MAKLTDADFRQAAERLGVNLATVRTVAEVESNGRGFLSDGRCVIRFEPHVFHRYTKGKYAKRHPDLSYPDWNPSDQINTSRSWDLFKRAAALDANAAVLATSWGMFQIMGFNFTSCGFKHLGSFVKAMEGSEGGQLLAFCEYIQSTGLDDELQAKLWAAFARKYNGTGYRRNDYDGKLARAYTKYAKLYS